MRRNRPGNRFAQQAGYTLVELATVLGILGVLTLTMNSAVESMQQARLHNTSQADAEAARQALHTHPSGTSSPARCDSECTDPLSRRLHMAMQRRSR